MKEVGGRCGRYPASVFYSHDWEKADVPVGGSALQCALHAPHNPSRPSPTGGLTGRALVPCAWSAYAIMRGTTYDDRQEREHSTTRTSSATRWTYARRIGWSRTTCGGLCGSRGKLVEHTHR